MIIDTVDTKRSALKLPFSASSMTKPQYITNTEINASKVEENIEAGLMEKRSNQNEPHCVCRLISSSRTTATAR